MNLYSQTLLIKNLKAFCVLIALSVLFFLNAWVSEDAYINFRVVEQLYRGEGLVWNPGHRVQVFTSPLWLLLTAISRFVSANLYLNVLVLSYALFLGTCVLLWKLFDSARSWLACCSLFLISSTFFDYTSSGLEYPLIYFLLAVFIYIYISGFRSGITRASINHLLLVFSLLLVTRHDLLILCLPPLLGYLWSARAQITPAGFIRSCVIYTAPFWLWTVFSLLYYGFPFPNTAYAKLGTGLETAALLREGVAYLVDLAQGDLITVAILVAATILSFSSRKPSLIFLAMGIAFSFLYVIYVGGDYMRGRFFSPAVLISMIVIALQAGPLLARAAVVSVWAATWALYVLVYYHTPIMSSFNHRTQTWVEWAVEWGEAQTGIVDARKMHAPLTSLRLYLDNQQSTTFPGGPSPQDADNADASGNDVIVFTAIGMFGYLIDPDIVVVDDLAIADPLLARIPVTREWRVSHYPREIPAGYLRSLESGENQISDANLHAYYGHLTTLTQGSSLFSLERLMTILQMNLGAYDHLVEAYIQAHPEIYGERPEMMYSAD